MPEDDKLTEEQISKLETLLDVTFTGVDEFLNNQDLDHDFHDFLLVVMQDNNLAMSIDWRWSPEDVFWRIGKLLPEHQIILTKSETRQYNSNYPTYDIEFSVDGIADSKLVDLGEPDYLFQAINRHIKDKQLVFVVFGDASYSWILVPINIDTAAFEEITGQSIDIEEDSSEKLSDLNDMDSNQIINNLDELLSQGILINEIVERLDNVLVIANYETLLKKGATNIDLDKLIDSVDPMVVLNNIEVFLKANVPVDAVKIIYSLLDQGRLSLSPYERWVALGASPQVLADKYVQAGGINLYDIQSLLDIGVHIDADKVIDNLLNNNNYLVEEFYAEDDVPILKRAGASQDAIQKLLKRISKLTVKDEISTYGGPYPDHLYLNENDKQDKKIFFEPRIQIITKDNGRDLHADWAGRVLPGQTLKEGIAAELKEVYGYTGKFEWRNPTFKEWVKDNQGGNIQRYEIYITLFPSENDDLSKLGLLDAYES